MKKIAFALLFTAMAALAVLCVVQHQKNLQLQTRLTDALSQLKSAEERLAQTAEANNRIALAETKAKVLQETLTESAAMSASQVSALEASLAAVKTNATDLGSLLNDPDMREMIRAQQKAFMGPMIDKSYAALFKELKLT